MGEKQNILLKSFGFVAVVYVANMFSVSLLDSTPVLLAVKEKLIFMVYDLVGGVYVDWTYSVTVCVL